MCEIAGLRGDSSGDRFHGGGCRQPSSLQPKVFESSVVNLSFLLFKAANQGAALCTEYEKE